jgi:hypothetical protein
MRVRDDNSIIYYSEYIILSRGFFLIRFIYFNACYFTIGKRRYKDQAFLDTGRDNLILLMKSDQLQKGSTRLSCDFSGHSEGRSLALPVSVPVL